MHKLRSTYTFSTHLACWGFLIFLMQLVLTLSLDDGQGGIHVIFENPITSIIKVPEALTGKQRADAAKKKPSAVQLTKDEHWVPEALTGKQRADAAKKKLSAVQLTKDEHLFHTIIVEAATRHEVDPVLVKAIIMAESGYNPKAISKKGAKGLMQLMPGTAKALGVVDIFNPKNNIDGGVRYFKQLANRLDGDVKLALAAYNSGFRKVKKYRGVPPFKATKYYIKNVFRYYKLYSGQTSSETKKT